MAEEDVKLITTRFSPFGMRVHLALELKGIKYKIIEEDIFNKSKLLLESNPVHKKVPVLIHNGKPVAESAIILHYLDEMWPDKSPFFPKDPYTRSQLRFWADYIDKKKFTLSKNEESAGNKDFIESCEVLENALVRKETSGPFFGGEGMSYADVMLAPMLYWTTAYLEVVDLKFPAEEFPNLKKLIDAIREHPSCKVAFIEESQLKAFLKAWKGPQ